MKKALLILIAGLIAECGLCDGGFAAEAGVPAGGVSTTRVVVLGTGNPSADPERWGPAVAIVVNDRAYLVDAGPGVVRRAAAAEKNGIAALKAKEL